MTALGRLAWAPQAARADDKDFNTLERAGLAVRTARRVGEGKVEWRITAAGAEKLYPAMRVAA